MKIPMGIILVHGYTGSPEDLELLALKLMHRYGRDSVVNIRLPGHDAGKFPVGEIPVFDQRVFAESVTRVMARFFKENRKIILLGHSTGGSLAVSILLNTSFRPDLLIIASAPKRIDSGYNDRWSKHRVGKTNIPFSSIAEMILMIKNAGSIPLKGDFPVLILHGEDDDLVPVADAFEWRQGSFNGYTRMVTIPSAKHDLFNGANREIAIDSVMRTISDMTTLWTDEDQWQLDGLIDVEEEVGHFVSLSPLSKFHLVRSPCGQSINGVEPLLGPVADNDPVNANIEITTRCNLTCKYCARRVSGIPDQDMPVDMFCRILERMPHAYRITIVGLGEPLLHPEVAEIVSAAVAGGRRTALVTNAMALNPGMALKLLKAGLHSIVFSLDGPTQDTASFQRAGSDLKKIITNIKKFMEIAKSVPPLSTAVFSAVSIHMVPYLIDLVNLVKNLGVHILMLTDLNFKQNLKDTLRQNASEDIEKTIRQAVLTAFNKGLPVLSVHGLEELGLAKRYRDYLLIPPSNLYTRSKKRTWCFSPWQTLPVAVNGDVTCCDCQPGNIIGNLLEKPFSEIWNGKSLQNFRQQIVSLDPPQDCRICPRF